MTGKQHGLINCNLLLIFGVTLMAIMGVTSISPAFPTIMRQLNLTREQVGLLISVFTVPGIFLSLVLGVAADRFGRKKILFYSLLLFGFAGGLCGFTGNFKTLLILRFFQGAGAAALGSLNITLIGDLYRGPQRAEAMGINAGVLSIGTASFPLLGGFLATFSWQYPFFLPFLALPLGLLILKFLNNPEPENTSQIGPYLKIAWQSIKNPRVLAIFSLGVIIFLILYGSIITYFSLFLGQVHNASSLLIGAITFIMSFSTAAISAQMGRLSKRFAKENLLKTGFLFYAAALTGIAFGSRLWVFVLCMIIFGLGHGMNIPSLQTLLADQAPLPYRAIFMSLLGSMLRIGQTLGPMLLGLAYTFGGYRGAFLGGALLAVLAAAIATLGIGAPADKKAAETGD